MTTIAGNVNYKIYLSTATTGAAGSETPTGDIVYFWAEDYDKSVGNLVKPKDSIDQSIYIPSSKYSIAITLKNCVIVPQGAVTSIAEANAIDHFIYTYSLKRNAAGMYLFIYSEAESIYRKLSWNTSGTHLQYLKVAIDGWNDIGGKGKVTTFPSVKFLRG